MKNDKRAPYVKRTDCVSRESILNLLSDDEFASMSKAEATAGLADGEEYLDLEQVDHGIRRALGTTAPGGQVLQRKALRETTWTKILTKLSAPRITRAHSDASSKPSTATSQVSRATTQRSQVPPSPRAAAQGRAPRR
jgi:hypothetical protein